MNDRKIIQISNSAKGLYALCDDGSVWAFTPWNGSLNDGMTPDHMFHWDRVNTEWVTDNEYAHKVQYHQG